MPSSALKEHFPWPLQVEPPEAGQTWLQDGPTNPALQAHFAAPVSSLKVHRPRRLQISPFLLVGQGVEHLSPRKPFLHMHFISPSGVATQSPLPPQTPASSDGQFFSQVRPPAPFSQRHLVLKPLPFLSPTRRHFPFPEHEVSAVRPGHSYWQVSPWKPCLHLHLAWPFSSEQAPSPPQVTPFF